MSVSLRTHRALVFEYHDAGSEGSVDSTYLVVDSGDADQMWWCSRIETGGGETTVGMQADHRYDAVFGFSAECPIEADGAIRCDGASYAVRGHVRRDYGRDEIQVFAERDEDLALAPP
jgi:hypothetical protein